MFLGVSFANRIHLQGATNVEDVDTVMWTEDLNLEYVLCAFININLILQNVLLLLLFRWHYSPMQNLKHGSGIINIIYIYIYICIYIYRDKHNSINAFINVYFLHCIVQHIC